MKKILPFTLPLSWPVTNQFAKDAREDAKQKEENIYRPQAYRLNA